jgi:hypothetical protein
MQRQRLGCDFTRNQGRMAKHGAIDIEPEGDKPALVKVDTSEISGKIVSIPKSAV